jgi:hypothetical protein
MFFSVRESYESRIAKRKKEREDLRAMEAEVKLKAEQEEQERLKREAERQMATTPRQWSRATTPAIGGRYAVLAFGGVGVRIGCVGAPRGEVVSSSPSSLQCVVGDALGGCVVLLLTSCCWLVLCRSVNPGASGTGGSTPLVRKTPKRFGL